MNYMSIGWTKYTFMELNKWAQKTAHEKQIFLAKLVDAMVYSDVATNLLESTLNYFEEFGFIKSVILPENDNNMPLPDGQPQFRTIEGQTKTEIIGEP